MVGDNTLVYNTPCALLINSHLDSKRVEGAFKQIIEKQSSFRTVFVLDADEVKQKILDKVDFAISVFNNTSTEKDAIIKNFSKPFDLENAPLLRVELHYLDNNQTLLLIDSHHIVIDGVSMNVLINEFFELYKGNACEETPFEYVDYSVWEKILLKQVLTKRVKTIG